MVAMSISLPQFFAYKESGLIAGNQGTGGTGGTGSQVGGDNYDDIITDIQPMNHPSWKPDPQFPTKPGDVIIINPGGDLQLPPDFEFRPVTKPGDQPILKPSESKKIDI